MSADDRSLPSGTRPLSSHLVLTGRSAEALLERGICLARQDDWLSAVPYLKDAYSLGTDLPPDRHQVALCAALLLSYVAAMADDSGSPGVTYRIGFLWKNKAEALGRRDPRAYQAASRMLSRLMSGSWQVPRTVERWNLRIEEFDAIYAARGLGSASGALTEMRQRDVVRGLLLRGRWQEAALEHSVLRHPLVRPAEATAIWVPEPRTAEELAIRWFPLTTNDPIHVVIKVFGSPAQLYRMLTVTLHDVQELVVELWEAGQADPDSVDALLERLWRLTLGAELVRTSSVPLGEATTSIANLIARFRVKRVRSQAQGFFAGLPLMSAKRSSGRYVCEDLCIVSVPHWSESRVRETPAEVPEVHRFSIRVPDSPDRPFLAVEADLLREAYLRAGWTEGLSTIRATPPEPVDYVHIASHSLRGWHPGHQDVQLNSDQTISPLDLADLRVTPTGGAFTNWCFATKADVTTDLSDYSVPASLLAAGAQFVVSPTVPVDDLTALRMALRVNERTLAGTDAASALRIAMVEATKGWLPTYAEPIGRHGGNDLRILAEYEARVHERPNSWFSYSIWEHA